MRFFSIGLTVAIAVALAETSASAGSFSFSGTFSTDDEVQLFNFSIGIASNVTLKSLSYAGGTAANGTVVSSGGFDPILALFDSSGNLIDENDDGSFPDVEIDPVTGLEYDVYFEALLSPGNYTVALSQYDNFFDGVIGEHISQGFLRTGEPTFTGDDFGIPGTMFVDVAGNQRTNAWAFDILGVDAANIPDPSPVPEPSTFALLSLGGLGLAGYGWRRRRQQQAA